MYSSSPSLAAPYGAPTARDRAAVIAYGELLATALGEAYLRAQGLDNVTNIDGGIDGWAIEIDQKLARY